MSYRVPKALAGLASKQPKSPSAPFRGSRLHVLEWTDRASFPDDLLDLVKPLQCRLRPDSIWMPRGTRHPHEARLERFGPLAYPGHPAWDQITRWWLASPGGAVFFAGRRSLYVGGPLTMLASTGTWRANAS